MDAEIKILLRREHYTENIIGIDNKGYPIKRILSKEEKQKFQEIIKIKQEALNNFDNLTIVAPSRWLAGEAKSSAVFNKYKVLTIPYGLESEIFKQRDKIYSREVVKYTSK